MPDSQLPGFHRLRPRAPVRPEKRLDVSSPKAPLRQPAAPRGSDPRSVRPAKRSVRYRPTIAHALLLSSLLLALACLLFTRHDLHHPRDHFGLSTPLAAAALLTFLLSRGNGRKEQKGPPKRPLS